MYESTDVMKLLCRTLRRVTACPTGRGNLISLLHAPSSYTKIVAVQAIYRYRDTMTAAVQAIYRYRDTMTAFSEGASNMRAGIDPSGQACTFGVNGFGSHRRSRAIHCDEHDVRGRIDRVGNATISPAQSSSCIRSVQSPISPGISITMYSIFLLVSICAPNVTALGHSFHVLKSYQSRPQRPPRRKYSPISEFPGYRFALASLHPIVPPGSRIMYTSRHHILCLS
ncbi:hypothetical protein B0H11DRAFT_451127 [Mycena galericulata]|nr:hypothetical protein B0H11DRAFT_451127 [Mycena galericulata]